VSDRATFVVTFQAEADSDGIHELGGILKIAIRRFGLRAIDVCRASRPSPAPVAEGNECAERRVTVDMKKFCGSAFLKLADLEGGPRRVLISGVCEGKFGRPEMTLDDGSKFSVNATNARLLRAAYGDDSDDWLDKEVELYLGPVEYNGEKLTSILVKPISPQIKKKPPTPRRDDMDDSIPF
jgi:hypothetical protein